MTNGRKSILIIDGDEHDRNRYVRIFTKRPEQYLVLEATDGRAGLKVWRSHRIDGVILAYELADFSGLRVLIRGVPRPRDPKTAVILLSKNPLFGMAALAKNNGAHAYLVKSDVTDDQLEATLLKAIETVSRARKRSPS